MYLKRHRRAIAMIELVFALVVMGLVFMSAPMFVSVSTSSVSVALQQEAINEASSRVNMILTYEWDESDTNVSCIPPVLHTTNGDTELAEAGNTALRIGIPASANHKGRSFKCGNNEFFASASLGMEPGETTKDDMDDFTGNTALTLIASGTGGKDYIEQTTVSITTTVSYGTDSASYASQTVSYVPATLSTSTPGTSTSNIKLIDVSLASTSTTAELGKSVIFHAFSCNIGGTEYESREIP